MRTFKKLPEKWVERVKPLMDHFAKIGARMDWEVRGSRADNTHGIIVQSWSCNNERTRQPHDPPLRFYLVRIWADGSGWDVYRRVSASIFRNPTLKEIT